MIYGYGSWKWMTLLRLRSTHLNLFYYIIVENAYKTRGVYKIWKLFTPFDNMTNDQLQLLRSHATIIFVPLCSLTFQMFESIYPDSNQSILDERFQQLRRFNFDFQIMLIKEKVYIQTQENGPMWALDNVLRWDNSYYLS